MIRDEKIEAPASDAAILHSLGSSFVAKQSARGTAILHSLGSSFVAKQSACNTFIDFVLA